VIKRIEKRVTLKVHHKHFDYLQFLQFLLHILGTTFMYFSLNVIFNGKLYFILVVKETNEKDFNIFSDYLKI
jgi:hypothetical protein